MASPIELSFRDSNHIIDTFNGKESPDLATASSLSTNQERIRSSSSPMRYFRKNVSLHEKGIIYLHCTKLNSREILETFANCTAIGAVVGGIVGGVTANLPGLIKGTALGGLLGASWALGTCAGKDLYLNGQYITCQIKQSEEYHNFLIELQKKEYTLFYKFLKNYTEYIPDMYHDELAKRVCPITYDLPAYPVFAPHDTKRLHPYEKSEIEDVLAKKEKEIAAYLEKAKQFNTSQEEIDTQVRIMRENVCPFKGPYFTKNQLVYDPDYVKESIAVLEEAHKHILQNLPPEEDPLVQLGLECLIAHYKKQHIEVTDKIVKTFAIDAMKLGPDLDQLNDATKKVREMMGTQKSFMLI
ncbi:MAG: hypothetical protein ACXWM7_01065 [Parachlamydiaceae bacterium]